MVRTNQKWCTQKGWKFDADSLKKLLAFVDPFPALEEVVIQEAAGINQVVEVIALYADRCWIHIISLDVYTICGTDKISEM